MHANGNHEIGLISDPNDPHTAAIAASLREAGHSPVLVDSTGGGRFSFHDGEWRYREASLDPVRVLYFRNMLSPLPPPRFDGEFKLYQDWYARYMHAREIFGVQLSWLYALEAAGKVLVNPPTAAGIGVLKPHQLFQLSRSGFPLPATLITNDPDEARRFIRSHDQVIFKPAMGGAYAELIDRRAEERLELIRNNYVIFQEYVAGKDIRVTATEEEVLVTAELESEGVDFRTSPGYLENQTNVSAADLPSHIARRCLEGIRLLGLRYSGIDLKLTPDGRYCFLEFNVHPAFLWIERKLKVPIAARMAEFLVKLSTTLTPR